MNDNKITQLNNRFYIFKVNLYKATNNAFVKYTMKYNIYNYIMLNMVG